MICRPSGHHQHSRVSHRADVPETRAHPAGAGSAEPGSGARERGSVPPARLEINVAGGDHCIGLQPLPRCQLAREVTVPLILKPGRGGRSLAARIPMNSRLLQYLVSCVIPGSISTHHLLDAAVQRELFRLIEERAPGILYPTSSHRRTHRRVVERRPSRCFDQACRPFRRAGLFTGKREVQQSHGISGSRWPDCRSSQDPISGGMSLGDVRGGSVCLNTVRVVSKWIGRSFQSAAGIGVAALMYA